MDEAEAAIDLGQSPADLVFLSFSDSDLGAVASAWGGDRDALPSLRLANLAKLKHPMSVDLYVEQVIAGARCVVIRLLGGLDYWRYGAEEVAHAARANGIPLALLPGDGRADARLAKLSTVSAEMLGRLDGFFAHGGPANTAPRASAHGPSRRARVGSWASRRTVAAAWRAPARRQGDARAARSR